MRLIGFDETREGITTTRRVRPGARVILSVLSGWDNFEGYLTPENVPSQIGAALTVPGPSTLASRFYLRDTASDRGGCPVASASTATDDGLVGLSRLICRTMTEEISSDPAIVVEWITPVEQLDWHDQLVRLFMGPSLATQTISAGTTITVTETVAEYGALTGGIYSACFVYLWRSGVGYVATLSSADPADRTLAIGASEVTGDPCPLTWRAISATTGENIEVLIGDRIIVELWAHVHLSSTDDWNRVGYAGTIVYGEGDMAPDPACYLECNNGLWLVATPTDEVPGSPLPEQTPYAYVQSGSVQRVMVRDNGDLLRALQGMEWSDAESSLVITMPKESTPSRYGDVVLFPTRDGIIAYEPASVSTKARLLSLKGPLDYDDDVAPTATLGTNGATQLFDCDDSNVWTGAGAAYTVATGTNCARLRLGTTGAASTQAFTKSLGSTGIDLTDLPYLVIDLLLNDDPQDYDRPTGEFLNDGTIAPSGYELALYEDTACTVLIKKVAIPKLDPLGSYHRIVFHLGTLTSTCKGAAILTASYWTAPTSGTWDLWVRSQAFNDGWEHLSNFLCPATANEASPWVDLLPPTGDDGSSAVILQAFNSALDSWEPGQPQARYSYCFAAKDLLGSDFWKWQCSNPSEESATLFADPWRTVAVAITLPGLSGETAISDYGGYVQYALIYRQVYDPDTETWSIWGLAGDVAIATSMTFTDSGAEVDGLVDDVEVPLEREVMNDFADTARFVVASQNRVVGLSLSYGTNHWARPLAIQVSGYGRPFAFPTTTDENSLETDGTELVVPAQDGAEIRGALARNDDVVVYLDNEFFVMRGTDPITGYRFVRIASKGCKSHRSIAEVNGRAIWHDGDHFYLYIAGEPQNISRGRIDSALIDWTAAHNAVPYEDKYLFWCKYDGEWSVLTFDTIYGGWRIRSSAGLEFVGICAREGVVFGITAAGVAVSLYGSATTEYSVGVPTRTVTTAYLPVVPPIADMQGAEVIIDAESDDPNGVDLILTVETQGKKAKTQTATVTVKRGQTTYTEKVNLLGNVVRLALTCTSATPPEAIYSMYLNPDPLAVR